MAYGKLMGHWPILECWREQRDGLFRDKVVWIVLVHTGVWRLTSILTEQPFHPFELTFAADQMREIRSWLKDNSRLDKLHCMGGSFGMLFDGRPVPVNYEARFTILWTEEALAKVPLESSPSDRWRSIFTDGHWPVV